MNLMGIKKEFAPPWGLGEAYLWGLFWQFF
jgi:hypothetical protein